MNFFFQRHIRHLNNELRTSLAKSTDSKSLMIFFGEHWETSPQKEPSMSGDYECDDVMLFCPVC